MQQRNAFMEPWPYFALAFLLVAAGFFPSFYAVLSTLDSVHLLHGWSATAWMLLPIGQAFLIRAQLRRWHRIVGYAAIGLAILVVLTGLRVTQLMALRNNADFDILREKLVYLDLTGLLLFCLALAAAIWSARKRDFGLHVRMLACTALIPLEAALERLLINTFPALIPDFTAALNAALFSMVAICTALIIAERRLGRVRWPFPALLGYYVLILASATQVASSAAFQDFCIWFGQVGQ